MDVLEHEHRRLLSRDGLDEAADGKEELLAVVDASFGIEPEQDRQVLRDRVRIRGGGQVAGDALPQLPQADLGRIALEDPA